MRRCLLFHASDFQWRGLVCVLFVCDALHSGLLAVSFVAFKRGGHSVSVVFAKICDGSSEPTALSMVGSSAAHLVGMGVLWPGTCFVYGSGLLHLSGAEMLENGGGVSGAQTCSSES
jgi:hypothetical protein